MSKSLMTVLNMVLKGSFCQEAGNMVSNPILARKRYL